MRLFEKIVYHSELHHLIAEFIGDDQYACKKGIKLYYGIAEMSTQMDSSNAFCVRIFSFDFSKAFDTVPHDILHTKLKQLNINPYIFNWIISCMSKLMEY